MRRKFHIFITLRFSLFMVLSISIGLYFIIYYFCKDNSIQTAKIVSLDSTKFMKEIRTYYSKEVIEKVKDDKKIIISFNHYNIPNAIPIPATFVLDTSDIISAKNLSLSFKFYSDYPFSNRANRKLDPFQIAAVHYLKENPTKTYGTDEVIARKPVYRLAVADMMVSSSCVNCHNSHPNSTKKDWKVGDFRGVLEAQYSLEKPFQLARSLSFNAFLFVFISISILTIFIFFLLRLVKSDFTKSIKFKAEMEASTKIQQSLIPHDEFVKVLSFEIASFFKPAEHCAGDWWQYYVLDENRALVLVGDVTGHGIASALVTAVVKGYCDNIKNKKDFNLNEILSELSGVVKNCSNQDSKLMSLFALLLDKQTKKIKFANAGHPFPLFESHINKAKISSLIVSGKLLGEEYTQAELSEKYMEKEHDIETGDVIVLFGSVA